MSRPTPSKPRHGAQIVAAFGAVRVRGYLLRRPPEAPGQKAVETAERRQQSAGSEAMMKSAS